jgi:hypothetical protein
LQSILITMNLEPKIIFRARSGLDYHLTDLIAFRGLIGFDNTARINIKGNIKHEFVRRRIPIKVFRDSWSVSFGVFMKFSSL